MKIDILTLFPSMFAGPFDTSMLKKAKDIGAIDIDIHDIRDWATDKHKQVDDRPFGGGPGMVLKVEPVYNALLELKNRHAEFISASILKQVNNRHWRQNDVTRTILLSPQGKVFNQAKAQKLAKNYKHIILIAGHYEGFDERIRENLIDEEISIGEFVLTGGEIPAMVITDAVVRLLPGVLEPEATEAESFTDGKTLDHPQYTRPQEFNGWQVPDVLLSGDHKKIEEWRAKQADKKTSKRKSSPSDI